MKTRPYHVHYIDAADDEIIARFTEQSPAWRFMRLCDETGVPVGYPVADDWNCHACRYPIR